jgi:hypothetical protein
MGADGMTSLLSRLQSLTAPSREIDAEIALSHDLWHHGRGTTSVVASAPRYTESLDAALTRVPVFDGPGRGLWIKLNQFAGPHGSGKTCWHAELKGIDGDKPLHWWGMHQIPAVALLIAIMKAKEEPKP